MSIEQFGLLPSYIIISTSWFDMRHKDLTVEWDELFRIIRRIGDERMGAQIKRMGVGF
jgi:hypothetical protein